MYECLKWKHNFDCLRIIINLSFVQIKNIYVQQFLLFCLFLFTKKLILQTQEMS